MPIPRKLKPKTEYQTGIAVVRPGRVPVDQDRADDLVIEYLLGKKGPNGEDVTYDIRKACALAGYKDTADNIGVWERILARNSKLIEFSWRFRGGITVSEVQARVGMMIRGSDKYMTVKSGRMVPDFAAMKADNALFLVKSWKYDKKNGELVSFELHDPLRAVEIMMRLMPGLEMPKPGSSAENPLHVSIDAETDRIIKEYQETHPEAIEAEFTEEAE